MTQITVTTADDTVSVDIPNIEDRDVHAFILSIAKNTGYLEIVVDKDTGKEVTNPKTPIQHVAENTVGYWVNNVRALNAKQASEQARQAALKAVDEQAGGAVITATRK